MTIDTDAEDSPRCSAISLRPGSFAGVLLCTPIFFEIRFVVFRTDSDAALPRFLDQANREHPGAKKYA
jgi:hypothetical protein